MDTQKQIEQHQAEIQRLLAAQKQCFHTWGEAYQDYDEKLVPIQENRPMGSDFFNPVTIGWETQKIPVWRRKCKNCGVTQTTTKTEPVIQCHRPVF